MLNADLAPRPGTCMGGRPRRWAWLLLAATAAVVAVVGPPGGEPEAEGQDESTQIRVTGTTSGWTYEFLHTNTYTCRLAAPTPCTASGGITTSDGRTGTTSCSPRFGTSGEAHDEGCKGHPVIGTWRYTGHATAETGTKPQGTCTSGSMTKTVASQEECFFVVDCTGDQIANTAGTECVDRPPPPTTQPEAPTTTEAAQTTQPPTTQPPSTTDPPGQRCLVYIDGVCNQWQPVEQSVGSGGTSPCNNRVRASVNYRRPKVWSFRSAQGKVARAWDLIAREWVSIPATPFMVPGGGLRGRPWSPLMQPGFLSVRPGGDVTVPARRQYDFTGADLPDGMVRGQSWLHVPDPTDPRGRRRVYDYDGTILTGGWSGTRYTGRTYGRGGCAAVTVRSTGAGWTLENVTLADDEAATSGAGRGELTFEGVRITDPGQPARLSAWEEWDVTVELYPEVGEPWPPCTPAEITAFSAGEAARNRQRFYAWSRPQTGWRPTGDASARSCAWSTRIWSATLIRITDCPDAQPNADGKIPCPRVGS